MNTSLNDKIFEKFKVDRSIMEKLYTELQSDDLKEYFSQIYKNNSIANYIEYHNREYTIEKKKIDNTVYDDQTC